jgi:hypothetical protein
MPSSPKPPARASGDILKNGTAVVVTFIGAVDWALKLWKKSRQHTKTVSRKNTLFM